MIIKSAKIEFSAWKKSYNSSLGNKMKTVQLLRKNQQLTCYWPHRKKHGNVIKRATSGLWVSCKNFAWILHVYHLQSFPIFLTVSHPFSSLVIIASCMFFYLTKVIFSLSLNELLFYVLWECELFFFLFWRRSSFKLHLETRRSLCNSSLSAYESTVRIIRPLVLFSMATADSWATPTRLSPFTAIIWSPRLSRPSRAAAPVGKTVLT